jgi:hypothetical protein
MSSIEFATEQTYYPVKTFRWQAGIEEHMAQQQRGQLLQSRLAESLSAGANAEVGLAGSGGE